MKTRLLAFACVVCVCLSQVALTASAALELQLLLPGKTELISGTGEWAYTQDGALQFTAGAQGATLAIETDIMTNILSVKYLQLSVHSGAPFNIALKMSGKTFDVYPQTTGPSWYEAFQDEAPLDGAGVAPGMYTMALDVENYLRYNDIAVSEDGNVAIKSVFVSLRGQGSLVLSHLKLSNASEFVLANGTAGTLARQDEPIATSPDEMATTTRPIISSQVVYEVDTSPIVKGVLWATAGFAVLMIVMPFISPSIKKAISNAVKKVKHKDDNE